MKIKDRILINWELSVKKLNLIKNLIIYIIKELLLDEIEYIKFLNSEHNKKLRKYICPLKIIKI